MNTFSCIFFPRFRATVVGRAGRLGVPAPLALMQPAVLLGLLPLALPWIAPVLSPYQEVFVLLPTLSLSTEVNVLPLTMDIGLGALKTGPPASEQREPPDRRRKAEDAFGAAKAVDTSSLRDDKYQKFLLLIAKLTLSNALYSRVLRECASRFSSSAPTAAR